MSACARTTQHLTVCQKLKLEGATWKVQGRVQNQGTLFRSDILKHLHDCIPSLLFNQRVHESSRRVEVCSLLCCATYLQGYTGALTITSCSTKKDRE